jgi:DNA modification methylase
VSVRLIIGDALEQLRLLPDQSVHCCVTSPPYYGLRDYGVVGQIGLEPSPDEYVAALVAGFREVQRALRNDGTLWLNIGDSYAGSWGAQSRGGAPSSASTLRGNGHIGGGPKIRSLSAIQIEAAPRRTLTGSTRDLDGIKPKDLLGIPWMLAFALRADGWYLRQDIIWAKPNPMPESVTDRCTKAHEYLFLLSKSHRYWFDAAAIAEKSLRFGDIPGGSVKVGATPYPFDGKQNLNRAALVPVPETRNKRSVWTVASEPFAEAHFATFPPALVEPAILAGCPRDGTVTRPVRRRRHHRIGG